MIRRFFRHLIESLKSLKRNGWMTIAAVSSVMITLSLVAIFASVIANTIKLSDDIQNSVRVVVYMRKDIQDQSEQIEKDGQTVTNENYHKVYDALTAMKHVDKVDFSGFYGIYGQNRRLMRNRTCCSFSSAQIRTHYSSCRSRQNRYRVENAETVHTEGSGKDSSYRQKYYQRQQCCGCRTNQQTFFPDYAPFHDADDQRSRR